MRLTSMARGKAFGWLFLVYGVVAQVVAMVLTPRQIYEMFHIHFGKLGPMVFGEKETKTKNEVLRLAKLFI